MKLLFKTKPWLKWFLFVLLVPSASWVVAEGIRFLNTPDGTVKRGITMAEVRASKGEPGQQVGPVGDPPIVKWIYNDGEVVVFEVDRVVDSFFRRD